MGCRSLSSVTGVGFSPTSRRPPPGLYAPQSGFGLVWCGDVAGSPGYRERLGWALDVSARLDLLERWSCYGQPVIVVAGRALSGMALWLPAPDKPRR